MKISTNLSFLKSVNQMPVHLEKGGKNDTEANNFPLPKHEAFKKKRDHKDRNYRLCSNEKGVFGRLILHL